MTMSMSSKEDKEYGDLRQFFTAQGWAELSSYEKLRLQNMKRNYEMMVQIGLTVSMPEFMTQKRRQTRKRSRDDSDDDINDDDWRPTKKVVIKPGLRSKSKLQLSTNQTVCNNQPQPCTPLVGNSGDSTIKDTDEGDKKTKLNGKKRKKSKDDVNASGKEPKRYYPRRNQTSVCYKEETVPDDDHFIYCEDCQEFNESSCHKHPLIIIEDKPVSQRSRHRAKHSLPQGLSIKETPIVGAGLGVFADKPFPKGVRFGPYKGEVVKQEDAFGGGYAWEICSSGKPSHYIDAKNETKSNWMRFVNCARDDREQNLVAFQYLGQIYYRSYKPIPCGTELLVYYGKDYARDLGIERIFPDESKRYQQTMQGTSSFGCEDCGRLFTIQIYLLKHLKYTHGKPIFFPRPTSVQGSNKGIMSTNSSIPTKVFIGRQNSVYDFGAVNDASTSSLDYIHSSERKKTLDSLDRTIEKSKNIWSESGQTYQNEATQMIISKADIEHTKNADGCIEEPYIKVKTREVNYQLQKTPLKDRDSLQDHHIDDTRTEFMKSGFCRKRIETSLKDCNSIRQREQCTQNELSHCHFKPCDKTHQCKTCGKSFSQSGNLIKHERIHSGDKPYQCKTCGKSFNQSGNLITHERIHSGDKPYQCKTCGKSFSRSSNLITHERIHSGDKPYQCKTCGKSFNQSSSLTTHERVHSGDKPYQCKTCGKSFNKSDTLITHERIHSGDKPYQCKTCGKSFRQLGNLIAHERIHSGDKPYQCKTCGKSFNQSSHLLTHERIHSGDKPYQCKTCGKSFNQSGSLTTHERVHSGDKPYQCKNSFTQTGHMKKHRKLLENNAKRNDNTLAAEKQGNTICEE